jgi:hypothetical protein
MKPSILILLLGILTLTIRAQVFVNLNAHGANDGTSWQNAYINLDSAISHTNTGEIWVAAGTYIPSLTAITGDNNYKAFNIKKNIALYGGFNGSEAAIDQRDIQVNQTVLSADVGIQGNDQDNSPRVIMITGDNHDSTTIIDGFTITKAYYKNGDDYNTGAVQICCIGNPIIRNCTITGNNGHYGGGIYVWNSRPLITNNLICDNVACEGAGIYLGDYLADARIIGNRIVNNKCVGDYSHLSGAGIQIHPYSSPFIYGNYIGFNSSLYGGGIANESTYGVVISNNIIMNNTSSEGGGLYINFSTTQVINNLIIGNHSRTGGGIYVDDSPYTNLLNNTFVNNTSTYNGGAAYLSVGKMKVTNTVFYSNHSGQGRPIYVEVAHNGWFPVFRYSDVENGEKGIDLSDTTYQDSIWKSGNISDYPAFIDSLNYNYQIGKSSVCVNAGIQDTTGLGIPEKDLINNRRISYNRIDMGCYEFDSLALNQYLDVSPRKIHIYNGWVDSTFSLNVASNSDWEITNSKDWISAIPASGSNDALVSVTTTANPNLSTSRSDAIFFSGNMTTSQTIPVIIEQDPSAYLFLSADTLIIDAAENSSVSFNIISNLSWSLYDSPYWLSLNKLQGANNDSIIVTATANPTNNNRTSRLSVSGYTGSKQIVRSLFLIQKSKSSGLNKPGQPGIELYPNPAKDKLTIRFPKTATHSIIMIYTLNGVLLASYKNDTEEFTIDMQNLESGWYIFKIIGDKSTEVTRIFRE